VEEFRAKGVTVRFLKEVLEFGPDADVSAIARFQFQMLGAVAEFERSLIRERQLEGIKAAKAKGKKWGGSTPKLDDVSARQMLEELQSRSITKTQAATKYRLSRQTVYTYIRRNSETI
jgi:DNA invertase Pin-like site-specific DNA recombinase